MNVYIYTYMYISFIRLIYIKPNFNLKRMVDLCIQYINFFFYQV